MQEMEDVAPDGHSPRVADEATRGDLDRPDFIGMEFKSPMDQPSCEGTLSTVRTCRKEHGAPTARDRPGVEDVITRGTVHRPLVERADEMRRPVHRPSPESIEHPRWNSSNDP